MRTLSLKAVSAVVVVGTLFSYAVNANELDVNALASEKAKQLSNIDFSKLASDFDADKDGLLSKSELSNGKGLVSAEKLGKAFDVIDANGDQAISNSEFNDFIEKSKQALVKIK